MIRFTNSQPATKVSFSVGMNPEEAQGETIDDLANKVLKVSFPNKLFLSVEHSTKDLGLFSFEFYYAN